MGQYCIYAHCTITHQGKCYIFLKLKLWNTQEIKCESRIFYIQKMNVCLENFNLDSCVHQLEMWFSIFSFPQMITTFFLEFFSFPCSLSYTTRWQNIESDLNVFWNFGYRHMLFSNSRCTSNTKSHWTLK